MSRVTSSTSPWLPNSRRAFASASAADSPRSMRSRTAMRKWLSISSLIRRSRLLMAQDSSDRDYRLLPSGALREQLLLAGRGEPVDLYALLVLRLLPFRCDPFGALQTMQRGVERPRIRPQHIARAGADGLADSIAVPRPPLQGLQDQQVERALQQFNPVAVYGRLRDHVDILH